MLPECGVTKVGPALCGVVAYVKGLLLLSSKCHCRTGCMLGVVPCTLSTLIPLDLSHQFWLGDGVVPQLPAALAIGSIVGPKGSALWKVV